MSKFYRYFATSDSRFASFARRIRFSVLNFSVPAPGVIFRPILLAYLAVRSGWYFCRRVFYAEPLFKAYCKSHGRYLHTDIHLHWVSGKGDIIIGDNVTIDGLCSFTFSSRYSDHPTITIGSNCHISSGCAFVIGKLISIGDCCQIAGSVSIRDSDGHPIDAASRRNGDPPPSENIRPVTIEDNVWIGAGTVVGPGITIGEGSIVAAHSAVLTNVAPYIIVAGNPARKIGVVRRTSDHAEISTSRRDGLAMENAIPGVSQAVGVVI